MAHSIHGVFGPLAKLAQNQRSSSQNHPLYTCRRLCMYVLSCVRYYRNSTQAMRHFHINYCRPGSSGDSRTKHHIHIVQSQFCGALLWKRGCSGGCCTTALWSKARVRGKPYYDGMLCANERTHCGGVYVWQESDTHQQQSAQVLII